MIFISVTFAALNTITVKGTARLLIVFTALKLLAISVIVITGLVYLLQGSTQNFSNAFEGSNTDPGNLALAIIPGFVSYSGW